MIKFGYILKETLRNIVRHPTASLASFLSLTLLLLLFDLFWIGAETSSRFYRDLIAGVQMEGFVEESFPDSALVSLEDSLQGIDGVQLTRLVGKDDARYELARLIGADLLIGYDSTNPLPRSFVVTPDSTSLTSSELERIEGRMLGLSGIVQVNYSRDWLAKAETTHNLVRSVGLFLGGLILLTALISSLNGIRLTTRVRAVGLSQLRLLGASKLFLSVPFLLESTFIAALAAAAGWGIIWYGLDHISFTAITLVLPGTSHLAIYIGACAFIGLVSAWLGIRRLVR